MTLKSTKQHNQFIANIITIYLDGGGQEFEVGVVEAL